MTANHPFDPAAESDTALMQMIAHQDRAAFAELMTRHIDALHRYAVRLSNSNATADDLIQETWLTVWQKAASFDASKASLSTWLHRLLHNRLIDWQRKHPMHGSASDDLTQINDPNAGPEQQMQSQERWQALQYGLNQLPQNQRAAVVLSHLQGLNNAEVAQVLGVSLRAAESTLARARRALKQRVFSTQRQQPGQRQQASQTATQTRTTK